MKTIVCIIFLFSNVLYFAQAKLGMSAFTSSLGLFGSQGNPMSLTVYVKNKGNATFTGTLVVNAKVDTLGGVSCGFDSISAVTIAPNDSLPATLNFTPFPGIGGFNKVNCCGNVIVVWPYSSNAIIQDSLRLTVYINNSVGLSEYIDDNVFKIYPNPTNDYLTIKQLKNQKINEIRIYDSFSRIVKEINYTEIINISNLNSGTYFITLITVDGTIYRKMIIKQ